jgi:predicted acetyltransferase
VIEIRTPTEEEREQIASVMSISLNFGQAWAERRAPFFRLEQFLVAVDDGRVVATSAARPFLQWFGRRTLPMTGIYAVATLPEHRGGGLASQLVTRLLRRKRILSGRGEPDVLFRAVVVRGEDGGVEGFCPFRYGKASSGADLDFSFGIETHHLVARSEAALRSLLAYFRSFRGLGETLQWSGPPADPIALLIDEQKVVPAWTFRWMLRLLDVLGALEARGYPPVSGTVDVTLRDPAFAEDDGATYHLEAEKGKVRASRVEDGAGATTSIGTFSSLFTGFTSPADAVRVGAMEADDDAVEFLSTLFAGPAPWLPEWF